MQDAESKNKELRSGFTTGACAAAAAKAAAMHLMRNAESTPHSRSAPVNAGVNGMRNEEDINEVSILLPDGSRVKFKIHDAGYRSSDKTAYASVIKDAGDDPDITHGAEIRAEVSEMAEISFPVADSDLEPGVARPVTEIMIRGGKGVGTVTKPGLAVPVGQPAINPVPRKMIRTAVLEALAGEAECRIESRGQAGKASGSWALCSGLKVTISVPGGEELAKKTLNSRLGIVGGISILGTTGIVRPISTEAYTASITAGMDVAKAMGRKAVVLSSGRTSEKAHMNKYKFPDEAYVMMGDYLEFSLQDAEKHGFSEIHICAQWAKMIKTAMSIPQTHVRHGAIEGTEAAAFVRSLGFAVEQRTFNTAREVFDCLLKAGSASAAAFSAVCRAAKQYAETAASGIPVIVSLVSYEGEIIADCK
jgi:cobalt-precorrin-5B (C1)-methyltransferase